MALRPDLDVDRRHNPFSLPFPTDDFELTFDEPVTIIVGENGVGKSSLLVATPAPIV